jgi:N-methylhydantoinase A
MEFDMTIEQIADSAIRLADANVVRAIQLISTELGRDPRDYVLVPFGGAGPLHAGRIAEDLGVGTIVVPQNAGVLSAFGLLASDYTQYDTVTRKVPLAADAPDAVRTVLATMAAALDARMRAGGMSGTLQYTYTLQMRFVGQAFEVEGPLPADELPGLTVEVLAHLFDEANRRVYMQSGGSGLTVRKVEIVGFRAGASASAGCPLPPRSTASADRPLRVVQIHENREARSCTVLTRAAIRAQHGAAGPLLVEDDTATIYVPPGWHATEDAAGNLILEYRKARA